MAEVGQHQVDRGVAAAAGAVSELVDVSLLGLDQRAVGESLVALVQLESRVGELKHPLLAHATAVRMEEPGGATTTATWFATETRTTVRAARRSAHLAAALESCEVLRAGMAAGAVNLEQGEVIARALEALPQDLAASVRVEAEETLVELAARHDAMDLRVLGDRILVIVAPEVGEAHEARQLAEAELAAAKATMLSMTPDGSGTVRGRFVLPELHAGVLRKLLMAYVVQHHKHPDPDRPDPDRPDPEAHPEDGRPPRPERRATHAELGEACCELLERLDDTAAAPQVGGTGATVVVTMTLDALTGGLTAATLDTGDRITAATARRLACEAGIVPVVIGGKSEVLDQGRTQRYFTRAQRIALVVRDKGCTAQGCQTAPWFCHAHHDRPWALGGNTDLADGRVFCPTHHRMAHDDRYQLRVLAGNQVEFTRRI